MVMNIVLYGVSAEIAGKIAGKYGLKLISTPDKFQPSGTVVLVPPMGTRGSCSLSTMPCCAMRTTSMR